MKPCLVCEKPTKETAEWEPGEKVDNLQLRRGDAVGYVHLTCSSVVQRLAAKDRLRHATDAMLAWVEGPEAEATDEAWDRIKAEFDEALAAVRGLR